MSAIWVARKACDRPEISAASRSASARRLVSSASRFLMSAMSRLIPALMARFSSAAAALPMASTSSL